MQGAQVPSPIDMAFVRSAFSHRVLVDGDDALQSQGSAAGTIAAPAARRAAVAAVLCDTEAGASVLLIRRAARERDPWSGHMGLPGGFQEREDADLVQTAIRETREEVSLDLARDAQLLAQLGGLRPSVAGKAALVSIVPLVFALPGPCHPLPNPREVEEIVWAPLAHLLSPGSKGSHTYQAGAQRLRFPAFDVRGRIVWGLTYRILQELLGVLRRATDPREQRPAAEPDPDDAGSRARPAKHSGTKP
jgi:8-oxo-dGTP pyrophosphatase MutT (NUDIX family)